MKRKTIAKYTKGLFAALLILYPFAVYFGLQYISIGSLGLLLVGLLSIRLIMSNYRDPMGFAVFFASLLGVTFNIIALVFDNPVLIRLYPVVMSMAFFAVFFSSLFGPMPLVTRMALVQSKTISPEVLHYTTQVTKLWSLFLAFNACISFYTVFWTSAEIWTLYNGLVSYVLMGTLFVGEFVFRHRRSIKSGRLN